MLLGNFSVMSKDTVLITTEKPALLLKNELSYYKDSSAQLTLERVREYPESFISQKNDNILSFGYTNAAIWVKCNVVNQTTSPLYVEVLLPSIDTIDIYAITDKDQVLHLQTGYHLPFESRSLSIAHPNFKLPTGTEQVYIRARNDGSLALPIKIGTIEAIIAESHRHDVLESIMIGIIVFMLAYSILKWISSRENLYLYYIPLLGIVVLSVLRQAGYDSWLLPFLPHYWVVIAPILGMLSMAFYVDFLEIHSHKQQGIYAMIILLVIAYATTALLGLLGFSALAEEIFSTQSLVSMILVLLAAVWVYIKGHKPAIYFIIAYICLIGGVAVNILLPIGFFSYNVWTANALSIGSSLQVILFTLAISDKANRYKAEAENAKQEALRLAKQNAKELDAKVKARTEDLNQTNEELQASEEELKQNLEELQATQESLSLKTNALAHKEKQLRRIFDGVPAMIYQFKIDPDGNMSFPIASHGSEEIYGLSPDVIMKDAKSILSALHPSDVTTFQESIQQSAASLGQWHAELRTVINDKVKWVEGFSQPEKMEDGSIVWSGMVMDITERKFIELEIEKQQQEVIIINEQMRTAFKEVQYQKQLVDQKHGSLMSSLNYAQRIQQAMLPQKAKMTKSLPNSFVFYKPRDIVSGDFYWIHDTADFLYISSMDCTGHGVPGAFMSLIGNALLNEAVINRKMDEPDQVLTFMQLGLIRRLHQEDSYTRDGMEGAICIFDKKKSILKFSGARTPLVYVENRELNVIKGDRLGIGGERIKGKSFTSHHIPVTSSISCYLYSDGYQDQFGGEEGRKFMSKKLRKLIYSGATLPFEEQGQRISDTFYQWKGNQRQIDDVMVIGFQLDNNIANAQKDIPKALNFSTEPISSE